MLSRQLSSVLTKACKERKPVALAWACQSRSPLAADVAISRLGKPGAEGLFQLVAGLEFRRYGEHLRQLCGFFGGQVFAILDQQPAPAFQDGLGGRIRLSLNSTPGFRERSGQVLHDVKAVHHALGLREQSFGDGMIGIPHIGAARFDVGAPGWPALCQPVFQACLAAVGQHIQHQAQFRGRDDQAKVAVPLVGRDFIQAQHLYERVAALGKRFFAACSKMARTVSWLKPSSCAT